MIFNTEASGPLLAYSMQYRYMMHGIGLEFQWIFIRNIQIINLMKCQNKGDQFQYLPFGWFMFLGYIVTEYSFNQEYPFKLDKQNAQSQLQNNNHYE